MNQINQNEYIRMIGLSVSAWTDEALKRCTADQLIELRRYFLNEANRIKPVQGNQEVAPLKILPSQIKKFSV